MEQHLNNNSGLLQTRIVRKGDDYLDSFYWKHTMGGSIADSLETEIPNWTHQNAVFICAQPGRGKTTFVRDVLIERATRSGKNVLLLSSRLANSVQQKRMIAKQLGYQKILENLTERGLREHIDFGCVKIMTYQGVSAFLKDSSQADWLRNTEYVIFDECQYFAVDALFNKYAGSTLRNLIRTFSQSIRIYMTATPYDVQDILARAEKNKYYSYVDFATNRWIPTCCRCIHYYNFPADYSAYRVDFFSDYYEDIVPKISENANDKWLIFCENKGQGQNLQTYLQNKCQIQAAYLDADRKDTPEWETLCCNEQFDEQVLICTTVLDCGVNIHDKALRHIVLAADNQTTFIQCLGRKRLDAHETVKVHVMEPDAKLCANRKNSIKQKLQLFDQYDTSPHQRLLATLVNDPNPSNSALFYYGPDSHRSKNAGLFKNCEAEHVLRRREAFYDGLTSGKITFREEVNRWLQFSAEIHEEDFAEPLRWFYEQNKGRALGTEEQDTIRKLVLQYAKNAKVKTVRKSREQTLDVSALNRILEDSGLHYLISPKWVMHCTSEGV